MENVKLITILGITSITIFNSIVYYSLNFTQVISGVMMLSTIHVMIIFFCTSIWIGGKTYKLEKYADYEQSTSVGWFIAESCLALGMVGTKGLIGSIEAVDAMVKSARVILN